MGRGLALTCHVVASAAAGHQRPALGEPALIDQPLQVRGGAAHVEAGSTGRLCLSR